MPADAAGIWTLIVTVWIASPRGAETEMTDVLAGYTNQAECVRDLVPAADGRMQRPGVVTVAARCERR